MFSRIRYAAQVLSSSPASAHERPDISFEEERPVEVTRASKIIGGFIELFVVSIAIGAIAAPFLVRFWPAQKMANVNELTAIVAAMVAMLFTHFFERFKEQIATHFRIGERVAPYFGHRITEAIRTLRS